MTLRIEDLARPVEPLDPELNLLQASRRLAAAPGLPGLPVALDGLVVGLLSRDHVLAAFTSPESRQVLSEIPVTRVMRRDPFMVDPDERAVVVARRISQLAPERLRGGILAVRGQSLRGLVETGDLIRALASENTAVSRTRAIDRDQAGELAGRLRRQEAETRELLAVIGHELRTPLNALMGHGERIARGASSGDLRESSKAIREGCLAMDAILTRLMETGLSGRAAGSGASGETVKLRQLAAELQALWTARAAETGTELHFSAARQWGEAFQVDGAAIRQVLNNLLSNALKYAAGGTIAVELELCEAGRQRELIVRISDDGPGIDDGEKPRVFAAHHRSDGAAAAAPGHGLGLHLARQTARSAGGDLTVGDSETGGAAFELRVPVRAAVASDESDPGLHVRRESLQLGELLLVEDHAPSLALARSALEAAGWKVDGVHNLEQAGRRLAHKPYQAVICDIHLPDGDGGELVRQLRAGTGPNRQAPVMALSADVSDTRRAACQRAGFDAIAGKPLQGSELVARVFDMIISASTGESVRRSA